MEFLYIFAIFFLLIFGAVMLIKTVFSALLGSRPRKGGNEEKPKDKGV